MLFTKKKQGTLYGLAIQLNSNSFDDIHNNAKYKKKVDIAVIWNGETKEFTLDKFIELLKFDIIPCSHWGNKETCEICRKELG